MSLIFSFSIFPDAADYFFVSGMIGFLKRFFLAYSNSSAGTYSLFKPSATPLQVTCPL